MSNKLVYPELSYKIIGLCFKVHNEIGRFGREKQYGDRLETVLKGAKIKFQREAPLVKHLPEQAVGGNFADFIIEGQIVVEIKAKQAIERMDYNQVLRYLYFGNLKLGLLVNFGARNLSYKRVLNSSYLNSHN